MMPKEFKNDVHAAVYAAGGLVVVARMFRVSNTSVLSWINKGTVFNIAYARKLAEIARMDVERIRPVKPVPLKKKEAKQEET